MGAGLFRAPRPSVRAPPPRREKAANPSILTRRIEYFRADARRSQMSENRNRLTMKHIRAKPRRTEAKKRHFRHHMAQFGAIFHPKSAHGSENPWDGIANPWDGSAIPWDGSAIPWDKSARTSRPAAFPTLKGGTTRPSALTVCHIAHKVREGVEARGEPYVQGQHERRHSTDGHPVARDGLEEARL